MSEQAGVPAQSGDGPLSFRGAICLGAVAWLLFAGATIVCVPKTGLIRPPGMHGGSCIGGVGDDCMARLVRQQEQGDIFFLQSAFALSAIPALLLAGWCYRSEFRTKAVLRWSGLGAFSVILGVSVFPVAFALVLLGFDPTVALGAVKFARNSPSVVNRIPIYLLDWRVLAASKGILSSDDFVAQKALAEYASSGQTGEEWREILLKLASANTLAKEQALICLGWRGDPRNLQLLGDMLLSNDETVATVPYQLMAHYGKEGERYIQRCVANSPNMKIRTACARELALKGKPEGFKFYLDNLDSNKGRMRSQVLQEMKTYVRGGSNLTDKQLPEFLAEHAK